MKSVPVRILGPIVLAWSIAPSSVDAQTTAAASEPAVLRLTLDDAVAMALEHNPALDADRLDPQISDTQVAQAAGVFAPTVSSSLERRGQLSPPTNFLIDQGGTRTETYASGVSLSQRLQWSGASYNVAWDSSRQTTNSFLQNFNPTLRSGISFTVSQPLLRDLSIDPARQQLVTSRIDRTISGTRYRESTVQTVADVKRAYWDLVAAIDGVEVQQRSLDLARELVRVNQARVDVGQAPPLDLVSAQAEAASREEALIVAQATLKQVEDRLRTLVLDPASPSMWTVNLQPVDEPSPAAMLPDVDLAVRTAVAGRADLVRARAELDQARSSVRFYSNQKLPDVRLQATYQTAGLGGDQLLRVGGFPGTLVPGGETTPFGRVLEQVFRGDYPTWTLGVSISRPIGRSFEEAGLARARLEETQRLRRLTDLEVNAIREVRQTAWQLEMNAKRIQATRAARELAEQRLDAEQRRFEVGMSTSFLVIQAQRDLAQARNNELAARLAYDASLIEFEAVQQAPASQGNGGGRSERGSGGLVQPQPVNLPRAAAQGFGAPTQ